MNSTTTKDAPLINRSSYQPWQVQVLFGASGTGKSTAARQIARASGATWMQVDDLRLALQYSRVTLPEGTDRLYFFETTPGIWIRPVDDLLQAFVDVAKVMVPAVRVVIDSHLVTGVPMVIEGDGVLPSLVDDPVLRPWVDAGVLRFCCLAARSHAELVENMVRRGRGDHLEDQERVSLQANANLAFNDWLVESSRTLRIPVVASRPFDTLIDRIEEAITVDSHPAGRRDLPGT